MTPIDAAAIAARVVDAGEPLPIHEIDGADDALALAWALKDHGYAAWSRAPGTVVRASLASSDLCIAVADRVPVSTLTQLRAIADWMSGIADLTRGRMSDALQAFDNAATALRSIGLPMQAARTQVPKIMALSVLGRHDQAADCGEAALAELRALGDVESASRVSLNLGNLHRRRNDFARATACFRASAVMSARLGDHERSIMADIGMADALASTGDFEEALRMFTRASQRSRQHGFPVLQALVDETVALVELARGQFAQALAGFESARRRYEALSMPQHLATAEKQLADAYLELHLLPEAARLFDHVMLHFEALEMPVEKAWTLVQRGRTQSLIDAHDASIDTLLTQAASLFETQGVPAGIATVTLARAERALARGDAEAGCRLATEAARIFGGAGLIEGRVRADAARCQALMTAGRVDESNALVDATLAEACSLQLLSVQVRVETIRGLGDIAAGREVAARRAFESAIDLFEDQRDALPGDDLRHAFQVEHLRPYRELLRLALIDANRSPSRATHDAVLMALERFRARTLGDRLGRSNHRRHAEPDDAIDLRARLNWLHRRLQRLNDDSDVAGSLAEEVRRTEHALLEQVRRQRLGAPSIGATSDPSTNATFDLERLRTLLAPDEALVEYGTQDDELFACVATHDGTTVIRRLARWPDMQASLIAAQFQIGTLRHGAQRFERHRDALMRRVLVHLERLYAMLWAPLESTLTGKRCVLIVPHEQLGSVPFAALHDGERHLVDRIAIALAPSARIAQRGLASRTVKARSVLALGETGSLQHAGAEARFVAGLFDESQVLEGANASANRLRRAAPNVDVVHLACHAKFRADNPMFSSLQLADGPLTVEAAERLGLRAGIVTLSGCETGLADYESSSGDEMVGLVRAFLVAGASRVVASLWPVDDAVTRDFMAHFYRSLQAGASPSNALRKAQLALKQAHAHPFHWAPFTVHGGF